MRNYEFKKENRGFTMIEMMIATTLFAIIMIIGIGAVLNVNSTHKKSQTLRAVIDNVHFITEDMARSMRIGANYRCPAGLPVGAVLDGEGNLLSAPISDGAPQNCSFNPVSNTLTFAFDPVGADFNDTDDVSDQVIYAMSGQGVFKSINGGTDFLKLTPPELQIDITKSGFVVLGTGVDGMQPRVTIRLAGEVEYRPGITTLFNLQTTVTQRVLDR